MTKGTVCNAANSLRVCASFFNIIPVFEAGPQEMDAYFYFQIRPDSCVIVIVIILIQFGL